MSNWHTSNRRSRLPKDWTKRVAAVKERDGGRCRQILPSGARCPRPGRDVDHRERGDNHDLSNLQLLCEEHHRLKTNSEWAEGKKRKLAPKRPAERNPGLL